MSAPLNQDDLAQTFSDGTRFRYNRVLGIFYAAFRDCGMWIYNATNSLCRIFMPDSAVVLSYDALGHHYLTQLPTGADFTITLNGTTIVVTSSGQVNITSSQGIALTANSGNIVLTASQGISLAANGGNIAQTASQAIDLTANGGDIVEKASGNITVQTGTHNDSIDNIVTTYNAHVHTNVQNGPDSTAATQQTLA